MSRNARYNLWVLVLTSLLAGAGAGAADYYVPSSANPKSQVVVAQGNGLLEAYLPDDKRVESLFNMGLERFTHASNVVSAWRMLLNTNDIVAIKVFSKPGPYCGTRPAVVTAMVHGLITAGVPPAQIILWDKDSEDLRASGFSALGRRLGIQVCGAIEAGYNPTHFYLPDDPVVGMLVWGDLEFGSTSRDAGRRSFVTRLLTHPQTRIISVAPLINEADAGICGHFYSLALGSVDNTRRFEQSSDQLSVALPEIIALPEIGDHVVLNVTDALLGQYQGGPSGFLQYATELDQIWFSHDPVALDVLAMRELAREAKMFGASASPAGSEIYTNAALLQLGVCDPAQIQIDRVRNF